MQIFIPVFVLRLIGAAGVGCAIGAAVAGLVAVVTGRAFTPPGNPWLNLLPVLVLVGALLGAAAARLSREWLRPWHDHHRLRWGVSIGVIVVPLDGAVSQLGNLTSASLIPALIGTITTTLMWIREQPS